MYLKIVLYNILLLISFVASGQTFNESYSSLSKNADSLLFINPFEGLKFAVQAYKQLSKDDENYVESLLRLARYQAECNMLDSALKNFKKGLKMPLNTKEKVHFQVSIYSVEFLLGNKENSVAKMANVLATVYDSLEDIDKLKLMGPLANSYSYLKLWDSAAIVYQKIEPVAQEKGGFYLGDYHASRAFDFYLQNRFDTAKYHYLNAIKILDDQNLTIRKADAHRCLSVIESTRNQYSDALYHITEAEKVYKENHLIGKLGNMYKNRAYIYKMTQRTDQAIKFYHEAIKIFEEENMINDKGVSLLNLADLYIDNINNPHKALNYLHEAGNIFTHVNNKKHLSITKFLKAKALALNHSYKDAKINLTDAHHNLTILKDTILLFESFTLFASLNNTLNKPLLAAKNLKQAETLFKKIQCKEAKKDFFQAYLNNNILLGKKEDALLAMQEIKKLRKALREEKQRNRVINLQIAYETTQREEKIAVQKVKNETIQLAIEERARVNFLAISAALLVFVFLSVVVYLFIYIKQKNRKVKQLHLLLNEKYKTLNETKYDLKDKHEEVNHLNKNLKFNNSQLLSQKQHIEHLHHEMNVRIKDNLQSLSTSFSLQMDELEGMEKGVFIEAKNRVNAIGLLHKNLYDSEQNSSYINLPFYIKALLETIEFTYNLKIPIEKKLELRVEKLSSKFGIEICLLLNEIINNAFKYAFPDHENPRLTIKIYNTPNGLSINVQDNGPGIPNDFSFLNEKSLGMKLIDRFVRVHKGVYTIESNNGLHYSIIFPLKKVSKVPSF